MTTVGRHVTTLQRAVAQGTVRAPGSKSQTHRAYVLAARSDGPVSIGAPLRAADTDATLACLHALGANVRPGEGDVTFQPAAFRPVQEPLDCRNAGTALRLLTAQAATLPFPVPLTGDGSLRTRPNGPLLDALRGLGVHVAGDRDGRCPYTVRGPVRSGHATLPAGVSSQYASALLLALPLAEGPSRIDLVAPVASRPYIDLTVQTMAAFGVSARSDAGGFDVDGGQVPRATHFAIEGDWSAAAFPLAAAAVTGGRVTVKNVRRDTAQGDRAILDHLAAFGADVQETEDAATVEGGDLGSPGTVDVAACPDLFPVLATVAAVARGTTTFTGGASLRDKETDRIAAMAAGLAAMGADVRERPDGMTVEGGPVRGATVASHGDHRIHMAFCVAALAADGETHVDDPGCVAVSYPRFHDDLRSLGVEP